MSLDHSGDPQKETPQHRENAEGSGVASQIAVEGTLSRLADHIIADSLAKGSTLAAASSVRRSVSSLLDPTGDPRIDAVLASRADIAARLANCGELVAHRAYWRGETQGVARYIADRCGLHLLCPFCAAARSRVVLARYAARCDVVMANSPTPLEAVMVTFTVKNGPDLGERFAHLTRSLRALIKHCNAGRPSQFSCFIGGAYGIEVKRGSGSGLWHPHVHMVALVPRGHYFDFKACKAEWLRWTGDSDVLNIKPLTVDAAGSCASSLKEVFKYTTSFKPGDLSAVERFYISAVLKGRRLFGNFGALRDPAADDFDSGGEPVKFAPVVFSEFDKYLQRYVDLGLDSSVLRRVSVDGKQGILTVPRPGKGVARLYGPPDLAIRKG